jgi:hypothetical protein
MNSNLFTQRNTTKFFHVVKKDNGGRTLKQLYKEARRLGELDTGYHFIVDRYGNIDADRPVEAVAGWELPDSDTSIYVLVDCKDKKLNDSQRVAILSLRESYKKLKYIESE